MDAARGREIHKNYKTALGSEYDYEVILPSKKRPDVVNWEMREVRELKSDADGNASKGRRQVEGYVTELEEITGNSWAGTADFYKRP